MNQAITDEDIPDLTEWQQKIDGWKEKHPLSYRDSKTDILQQWAIEKLYEVTKERDPYVAVGVGQHQMWTAQFYKFNKPRRWLSLSLIHI